MNRVAINCIKSCNAFLQANTCLSNGKNCCISQLCQAYATSRLPHENILGIYLAKPQFTWMVLWLAVTSRSHLRKRQVNYFRPDVLAGDHIGRAGIYNPQKLPREAVFCQKGYLYLFNSSTILRLPRLDISGIQSASDKEAMLVRSGFRQETVVRSREKHTVFTPCFTEEMLVDIDEWQVAVINVKEIVPDCEIVIEKEAIGQLRERASWLDFDIGENYIQPAAGEGLRDRHPQENSL